MTARLPGPPRHPGDRTDDRAEAVISPAEHRRDDSETEEIRNAVEGAEAVAEAPESRISVAGIVATLRKNDCFVLCHSLSFFRLNFRYGKGKKKAHHGEVMGELMLNGCVLRFFAPSVWNDFPELMERIKGHVLLWLRDKVPFNLAAYGGL